LKKLSLFFFISLWSISTIQAIELKVVLDSEKTSFTADAAAPLEGNPGMAYPFSTIEDSQSKKVFARGTYLVQVTDAIPNSIKDRYCIAAGIIHYCIRNNGHNAGISSILYSRPIFMADQRSERPRKSSSMAIMIKLDLNAALRAVYSYAYALTIAPAHEFSLGCSILNQGDLSINTTSYF
jgi:hypothetical protein